MSNIDHRLLHSLTYGDVVRQNARSYPNGVAVVSDGVRYTYPELDERVRRLAGVYRALGVAAGDRVLWLGHNSHRLFEAMLAAAEVGAMVCPTSWQMEADELAFVLADVEPTVVFWQEAELAGKVAAVRRTYRGDATWIQHDGDGADSYEHVLGRASADDPESYVDAMSPLLLMYTSAFDGRPNGAMLSQLGVMLHSLMIAMQNRMTDEYVYLNCGPMYRLGVLWSTFATLHMGGTNVFVPQADPQLICEAIARHRCNGALLLQPTLGDVIAYNRTAGLDLSSFRSRPGDDEWSAMTSPDPSYRPGSSSLYGQTEVTGLLTGSAVGVTGLHGRATPVAQLRIVDDEGSEVAPGGVGEIIARGPTAMLGYFRRPETNLTRQRGGWHHTNDLGRRELDGSVTFLGSKGRIVKSGIENVYPTEIEACLRGHAGVADAAVIGVPDAQAGGQIVKAVVVRAEGADLTADELIEHVGGHLAWYKVPRLVEFVSALPRQGAAVDYAVLDQEHGGGGYPGSPLFSKLTGL